jgi:parallel beta-helix repeat protein
MSRRRVGLVFGILVFVLLVGMFGAVLNVPVVKASGTIYIRADGSIDLPTAPISTLDNITYTFTANIYDSIVVERDNIIIDGNGYTLQGSGTLHSKGINLTGRSNVTIKNMEIKTFDDGIELWSSNYNSICGNNITNNYGHGIYLEYSSDNSISGNALYSNELGMYISAGNNTVVNNTIDNNAFGMYLGSSNNLLRDNELFANHYNLISPLFPSVQAPYNDIDISNTVNGKPIYYLVNQSNLDINPSSFPDVGYLALVNCFNVTVKGLTLTNNGQGILLSQCVNCTIEGNSLKNNLIAIPAYTNGTTFSNNLIVENYHGIALMGYYNQILDNTIANNTLRLCPYRYPEAWPYGNPILRWITEYGLMWYSGGIYLWAHNNTVINNSIINNEHGILLYASSFNVFKNNSMVGNVYNFGIDATRLFPPEWAISPSEPPQISSFLMNDVDASNTVNGKPIYWSINRRNEQVPTDAGYVVLVNSTNMIIRDLVLQNNTQGLLLVDVNNAVVSNNVIMGTRYGVQIRSTVYVDGYTLVNTTITHNNITKNGVGIESTITNSTFSHNVLAQNLVGIYDRGEGHNLIIGNNITKNAFPPMDEWILGYEPPHSVRNIYYYRGGVGIIFESSNNTVCYNNIQENENGMSGFSPSADRGGNHKIYHNNFINNTEHFVGTDGYPLVGGTCDIGYPGGGNYWSDYHGTDLFRGAYQNETGSDGIGDTPLNFTAYVIPWGWQNFTLDRYPLMAPISFFDAGTWNEISYKVDMISNSTVSGFQFNPSEGALLRFNVTGEEETVGFCRVAIPKNLLWAEDGWTVLYGSYPLSYETFSDENCTYLYFTYTNPLQNGSTTVTINGTHAIPEFLSFMILPLSVLFTMLFVMFMRRRIPRKQKNGT